MRSFFLIGILFFSLNVQAQRYKDVLTHKYYQQHISYDDHKVRFFVQSDQNHVNLDPEKKYHWFSANEIKITQGAFSGKLLDGLFTDFYLNNNLKEQGEFNSGLKVGEWKNWNEKGILLSRTNFSNGIAQGKFYKYTDEGKLLEEGRYRQAKINGKHKVYVNADSVTITKYKNGVLQPKKVKKPWVKKVIGKIFKTKEKSDKRDKKRLKIKL